MLVAPAMNTQMFAHEAVRANLDTLAARGVRFVEPGEGYLACGWIGKGRLAEPDEIVAAAEADAPARGSAARAAVSSPPVRPMRTSIRCGISATDRAAGSSGIIPAPFLGEGKYLFDVQSHLASADPELVEGGQLLVLQVPPAKFPH